MLPTYPKYKRLPKIEIAVALIISLLIGITASTGNYIYGIALIASVIAISIAISPVALLFSMILIGLVFAGLFRTYLPQLEYIRWALVPGSMALIFHALSTGLTSKNDFLNYRVPATIWWVIAFFVITVSTSIVNSVDFKTIFVGFKGYSQTWGILFALAFINYDKKTLEILPKLFLFVAFLQIPFVLQQYFILAPSRVGLAKGIVPIDVVSGTFGVSPMGGNNALLSAYLYICIAGCIALWQEKVWPVTSSLIVCLLLFFPTMMNEAKIGFVFLVVIFLILFSRYSFSSINKFIISILILSGATTVLLWAFVVNVHTIEKVDNPIELLQFTYKSNVEEDQEGWDGRLSKFGTFKYWFDNHGLDNLGNTMIGHGVGRSRQKEGKKGAVNSATNPLGTDGIGNTGFAAVLWETGLLGLVAVLGIFISGFLLAIKLSNRAAYDNKSRAIFRGLSAAIAVLFISFTSKNYFVYQVGYQTILFTILGYLLYWERISRLEIQDENKQ